MSHLLPPFPIEPEFRRFHAPVLIARGRCADVYHAHDELTGREVAVKILNETARRDQIEVERFLHGAALQSRIRHAQVLPIYDAWNSGTATAQVMAYAPMGTLQAYLDREEPIPLRKAAIWARELYHGAVAIHDAGVVHGDLKLLNLLLNSAGQIWISDFGEARSFDDPLPPQPQPIINGSPYYMAPECARGYAPEPASDRYSVGVILYRLFSGRLPFVGADAETVMRMQVDSMPVDPRVHRPDIPEFAVRFILGLLAKDPRRRLTFDDAVISRLSI